MDPTLDTDEQDEASDVSEATEDITAEIGEPPTVSNPPKRRRGRPKLPRDANGNIIRADGTISKPAKKSNAGHSPERVMTDSDAGKVISGAFMLASVPMGNHWRLFPDEEAEMGRCFGPLFRRYPEHVGKYADILMIGPAVAAVTIPRIKIQQMVMQGKIEKDNAREALMMGRAYMKAEAEKLEQEKVAEAKRELELMTSIKDATPANAA